MPELSELLHEIAKLAPAEKEHLKRALGADAPQELPLFQFSAPAPQSEAWIRAERGHAVLATDSAPAEVDLPEGPDAIAGMWADRGEGV